MGTCPECGKQTGSLARFCGDCGSELDRPGGPPTGGDEPIHRTDTLTGSGNGPAGRDGEGSGAPGTFMVGAPQEEQPPESETPGTVVTGEGLPGDSTLDGLPSSDMKAPTAGPGPGHFGRYRVIRQVGRGAMGTVYLARDERIDRNVAIKALRVSDWYSDEESREIRERFEREAKAAGMLSHHSIVTVHDVGEEGDTPYIAMEYLSGSTLGEVLREGPMPAGQALSIITRVLSALSYAHGHNVVHRDIKPDNIFLMNDGGVKVADFGIARIATSSTMTSAGQVMGTPGYMSPEQVKGEPVGPASDIFSTGVLLYELLTGANPFHSSSPTSVMYRIVHEEPEPLSMVNPSIPPYLEAVISRATAKNPQDRYPDAGQMIKDIEDERAGAPATSLVMPPQAPPAEAVPGQGTVMRQGAPGWQAVPLQPSAQAPRAKKRTGLLLGLGLGALGLAAVVAVTLFAVFFHGGSSLTIISPEEGEVVTDGEVLVSLDIKNPDRVSRVEIYLDGEMKEKLDEKPFRTYLDVAQDASHDLKVSAYGPDNRVLAEAFTSFESTGAKDRPDTAARDYPGSVSGLIIDASNTGDQIQGYAARINAELGRGGVSAGTLAEARDLLNRTVSLQSAANALSPPAEYSGIHAQFLQLCEYLKIRAESLVLGSESYNTYGRYGNYLAEFDRGGGAKKSFEALWPGFIAGARAQGIAI